MSNRKQARLEAKRFIDTLSVEPYPNSQKSYLLGPRPDIRVPVREITLSDTLVGGSKDAPIFEPNEPICVYDTSGVYTDPSHDIDLYKGLPKLREEWIEERRDTHILPSMSSHFARERLADETLDEL
ncbi:phosphomethylpyrimidine synthase ThiC, partial [Vibrio cholerae]|nr:phosphomethylpyrimidine synthase ThiC [Vibrio cholerae]